MATRASTGKRAEVRRALQGKLLRCLAGAGAVAAKENAELAAEFRLPRTRATNQAFLTLARGMLEKATAQKDLLVSRGMSEQVLADLAAAPAEGRMGRWAAASASRFDPRTLCSTSDQQPISPSAHQPRCATGSGTTPS